ncbi:hypothetical protein DBB_24640 [Desulfoluna spongiiphila]|nr:hypothetical protein DBB_24640 [Desulfoluna spongiiphila]
MRFAPRSSGQITSAFKTNVALIIVWTTGVFTPPPNTLVHWSPALLCGTGNENLKSRTGVRCSVSVDHLRLF